MKCRECERDLPEDAFYWARKGGVKYRVHTCKYCTQGKRRESRLIEGLPVQKRDVLTPDERETLAKGLAAMELRISERCAMIESEWM